jgi:hypothetical protein
VRFVWKLKWTVIPREGPTPEGGPTPTEVGRVAQLQDLERTSDKKVGIRGCLFYFILFYFILCFRDVESETRTGGVVTAAAAAAADK